MHRFLPFCALFACAALPLPASAFPSSSMVPGGVAIVRLSAHGEVAPKAWFLDRRVLVVRSGGTWRAVVGLPLALSAGRYELRVEDGAGDKTYPISVAPKNYPVQHLTIPDRRKVEPSPEDVARIEREQAVIEEIKRSWTEAANVDLDMRLPADGRRTGRFGARRVVNGQEKNPHAGIDVAVRIGTPVHAAAAGRVLDIGDYFFNGRSVFIDHGQGLITLYCHLSDVSVRPGDRVASGQPLGLSGNTGRSTGPHLHWTTILNGVPVDPDLFLKPVKTSR